MARQTEQKKWLDFGGQPIFGLAVALIAGIIFASAPATAVVALFVVLAVFAAGLLALQQPLWLLGATLALAPFGAWEAQHPLLSVLPLPLGQLAFIGTCLVWAVYWLSLRKRSVPFFGVQRPLVLFLFVVILSLLGTESMSLGAKEVIKWVEMLLIIWLILDVRPPENGKAILWILCILAIPAVIQALLGIAQFVQTDGPDSFLILDRFYRAYGTFQQPNPFGGFMATNGLLAIGIVIGLTGEWVWGFFKSSQNQVVGKDTTVNLLVWFAGMGVTAVCLIALIASWSRGAWLGFAAGGAVLALFWPRQRVWGISLILGGALLLVSAWQVGLLPDSIVDRVASSVDFEIDNLRDIQLTDGNYALLERFAFWQAAFGMAEQNLWLGVGFGAYDAAYADYAPVTWPQSLGHAHNYYLNLMAEIGILGLLSYVVFWSAVFWQNIKLLDHTHGLNRAILLGLLGCWVALSAHQLVDKLYVNNMYLHIGVFLALQQLIAQIDKEETDFEEKEEI